MRRQKYTDRALAASAPLVQSFGRKRREALFPTVEAFTKSHLSDYKPHKAQVELRDAMAAARFVTVIAGRRSGKTYGGGREFLLAVARDYARARGKGEKWFAPSKLTKEAKPLLWYWCVAPTYALGVYQRREIFEVLGGLDGPLVLKWYASNNSLWLQGGILIEFKTADNPNRLVGSGLNGAWVDEGARVKAEAWADNLRPALSDRLGWCLVTSTPLGKNWLYRELWRNESEDYARVHFRTVDNTALPHLVEEVARARVELPKAMFLRNYEASFDAFEGKIFEHFLDDATHIWSGTLPPFTRRFAGIDWGHSNPGTQIEIGQALGGELIVYREDYVRELPIAAAPKSPRDDCWIKRFRAAQRRGVSHAWADPSEPAHILQCRQNDIDVRRANNAVNPGIDLLSTLLMPTGRDGKPTLMIHESCTNLREELSSYRWGANGKPVKEDDHTVDALRYGVYTEAKRNGLFVLEKLVEAFPSAFDMAA